jgi:quercetin dioxygenase-like cupin family protein
MDWRPFDEAPGVSFKVLKTHKPGTGVTLLLRFDAGASYPAHRHPEGEQYYVLDGELVDAGRAYGPGTYVFHPPGSVHRPSSTSGATVLVFLPAAIELV